MKNKKMIYNVYYDDDEDVILLMQTTSPSKMKAFISKMILEEMFYYGDIERSPAKQAKEFRSDFATLTRNDILKKITRGFFETHYDGEEL